VSTNSIDNHSTKISHRQLRPSLTRALLMVIAALTISIYFLKPSTAHAEDTIENLICSDLQPLPNEMERIINQSQIDYRVLRKYGDNAYKIPWKYTRDVISRVNCPPDSTGFLLIYWMPNLDPSHPGIYIDWPRIDKFRRREPGRPEGGPDEYLVRVSVGDISITREQLIRNVERDEKRFNTSAIFDASTGLNRFPESRNQKEEDDSEQWFLVEENKTIYMHCNKPMQNPKYPKSSHQIYGCDFKVNLPEKKISFTINFLRERIANTMPIYHATLELLARWAVKETK
jgi:hypothetical protein